MRTLEKENANLKKTIKKLKEDLYNAKMELEPEHTSVAHSLRKGSQ